ncbi:MAG TPA: glycosyltransferase [Sphingomicrobium sp.]|nr:glycosyltransferase [Sphingomicrobium sp.]
MRILVFLHSFGPGGVERVGLRLAGAWADAGHDVRVLMGRTDGPERHIAPHNVVYDFAPSHPLARPFETLWMVRQLIAAVRRHRPDVLFCAGGTYTIVAALVRLMLGAECPPIVCKLSSSLDRRDLPLPARFAHGFWLRQHRWFIDRFVALSSVMGEEIATRLRLSADRVASIPNPVLTNDDLQTLSNAWRGPRDRGRLFVAVGRLTRCKNYGLLMRAFAQIAKADDRLLILGEGPQRAALCRLAARLGISGRIQMPGHVSSIAEVLGSADVFVSSSNYEGLPGVIVEALATGLPIVATASSPNVEHVLCEGKFGRIVPIRDLSALANALETAGPRESLPREAMLAVASQYTIERSARLYLEVLASAATSQVDRPPRIELEALQEAA